MLYFIQTDKQYKGRFTNNVSQEQRGWGLGELTRHYFKERKAGKLFEKVDKFGRRHL